MKTQQPSVAPAIQEAACQNPADPLPRVETPLALHQERPRARDDVPEEDRVALAIFRRAMVEGDERAWAEVYTRYRPLVTAWAHRITDDPDEVDAAVHAAFARMWRAVDAAKFARFPNLSSLLQYLKLCVRGAVLDARRDQAARAITQSWEELLARHHTDLSDLDVDVETHLIHDESLRDLWALLRRELPERRERLLTYLSYVAGLPPREIVRRFPEHFGSIEEIYRLKWAICERLRRCDALRNWWMGQ